MKKGEIIEGIIEKVEFPNKGILVAEDTRLVVKNSIPGQRVRVRVGKLRKGKGDAALLEVLEKSPLEAESPCPHFGSCGGCLYLSLSYEDQLKIKEKQVEELLGQSFEGNPAKFVENPANGIMEDKTENPLGARVIKNTVYTASSEKIMSSGGTASSGNTASSDNRVCGVFEGIRRSPQEYGYRNKMEFTFGDEVKDGPLALGMHKRGGFYDIVTVDGCRIVDEDYRRILRCVCEYFRERQVPFYHRMRHKGYLRHLLVRKGVRTGEILVDLVTTSQLGFDDVCGDSFEGGGGSGIVPILSLKDQLLGLSLQGKIVGILHTINDSLADAVKNDRTVILYGRDYFYEELLGLSFRISPFSFFQTNTLGAEVLYRIVREFIGDPGGGGEEGRHGGSSRSGGNGKIIFDLYSGTGTIAQVMAPVAKKVIGVELVEEAVLAARENAKRNRISNCEFIAGDVLKVLDEIEEKPDIIILDPPRDGVHPKALRKIIAYGADRMIYISCKPTSLARDLGMLLEAGYEVARSSGVDMFAWTGNVETVVLLSKLKSTS